MDTFKYNNLVSSRNHNPLFCFLSFFQIYKKYKSFNTTILFPLGILFGYNKEKLTAALSKHYGVKLLIIISVSIALLLLNSYALRTFGYWTETPEGPGYLDKLITLLVQTLYVISFVLLILQLSLKVKLGNPIINFIGKISLELYLIHEIFCTLFIHYLHFEDALLYLLVIACSILSAVALYYLDKALLKPFKR